MSTDVPVRALLPLLLLLVFAAGCGGGDDKGSNDEPRNPVVGQDRDDEEAA